MACLALPPKTAAEGYAEIRRGFLEKHPHRAAEVERPSVAIVEERFRFLAAWWLRDVRENEGSWAKRDGEYRARQHLRALAPNVTPFVLVAMPRFCPEVALWHDLLGDLTEHAALISADEVRHAHWHHIWRSWWAWGHAAGLLCDGSVCPEAVTGCPAP